MSGVLNKIADAVTGHSSATNASGTTTTSGSQPAGVGSNFAGTNYGATNSGALKEGAQVRDTGLYSGTSSHLGSSSLGSKGAGFGHKAAPGAGAGAGTGRHHIGQRSGAQSDLSSSTASNLGSSTASSLGSSTSSSLGSSTMGSTAATDFGRDRTAETGYTDDAMTRSEEHLLVGKEKVNVGKAALNKYVTTEKVSTAVPIVRERAVIEREPITDSNREAAYRGPDFKESHYEVPLMEERAVAEKEEVPIERVRLRKEAENTQQYVEADLRKEHIELVDPNRDVNAGGKHFGSGIGAGTSSNLSGTTTSSSSDFDRRSAGTGFSDSSRRD